MRKRLFIMDIDGTLLLGNQLIDGAADLVEEIHRQNGICCYFTNNSSRGVREYVDKFRRLGMETKEEEFVTAGTYAISFLKETYGTQCIYVMGTQAFVQECKRQGLCVTQQEDGEIAAVLTTYDRELTYEKIAAVSRILQKRQIPWYATNEDLVCPFEDGVMLPDCGAISGMIAQTTGKKPEYLGKPNPKMAEYVLKKWNCRKEEALLVGDRLYTDIACGKNAQIDTCLVLTGEEKTSRNKADLVLASVRELADMLIRIRQNEMQDFPMHNWTYKKGRYDGGWETQVYSAEKRWFCGDFHIHTTHSDGHDTPKEMKIRAEQRGLDYYAVTDHNVWQKKWPATSCMVLPGTELSRKRGHANIILTGKKKIFSLNHPFLDQWSWKKEGLKLERLTALEVNNNPTFACQPDQHAEEANRKAVLLSDLLWEDGYRICAIGGSDVHLKESERYGNAAEAPQPGDPMTWCYMDGMTPEHLGDAVSACHVYVARNCEIQFSCSLFDGQGQKLKESVCFGDRLPEQCVCMEFQLQIRSRESRICVFVIQNGKKQVFTGKWAKDGWKNAQGKLHLEKEGYQWIRFGAETEDGGFLFYANPFTWGKKKPELLTFGEAAAIVKKRYDSRIKK